MSDFILKHVFGSKGDKEQEFFSRAELGDYISEQLNASESTEKVDFEIQIFQNALEFSGVKARDIMTPRTEISGIEVHDAVEKLKEVFIETGYSKVLVYQNSIDEIVGYVHSFDLFKKPKTVKAAVIPVEFVPETILIKDIMDLLTRKRRSVAVVLDEYGGTAGIVTIEDIVEELFGEIEDEHDGDEEYTEKQLGDNAWMFSARLDVAYLNETYRLDIPESDSYSTLGGYIVDHTKEIPEKGETIKLDRFIVTIEAASGHKIELIRLESRE